MHPEVPTILTLVSLNYNRQKYQDSNRCPFSNYYRVRHFLCCLCSDKLFSFHFSDVAALCPNDTWREGARRRQGISWLIHCLLPDNHDKVINE